MSRILFVIPYPLQKAPSQRFRFEHYLPYLKKLNTKITVAPFISEKYWSNLYNNNLFSRINGIISGFIKRFLLLFSIYKFKYVFIHREATPIGPPWFEFFTAKVLKKKIIYDFDDAIWLEDPDEKGSLLAKMKWKKKIASICRWSYKISAGNEYLASYARQFNNNVVVIPTVVDTENYHNPTLLTKKSPNLLQVGWTGTHSTLSYLNSIIPVLKEVHNEHPFTLRIIANKAPEFDFPDLEYIEWSKETEMQDLYQIDIGIMPLTDDQWSGGKCGFKLIQYMALSVPAVASDVGVNKKIIDNGVNGYIAKNHHQWKEHLLKLLKNDHLRKDFGFQGRKKIVSKYSVRATQNSFLQLFENSP